jgi:glycosyltransferase involved in cell wall biosynthesis
MAHLGLNASLLRREQGYRGAGVSSYILRLLRGLAQCAGDHTLTVLLSRAALPPDGALPPAFGLRSTAWPLRRAPLRLLWEATALPLAARRLDLLHTPVNVLPPWLPCPGVVTVHDLAFLRYPQVVAPLRRRWLAAAVRASARRAAAVIAVSACTRRDLIELWDIPAERVHVVYPAIDPACRPVTDDAAQAAFAARHGLARPYILFLGTLEPRKNLATLLDAFALARDRGLGGYDLVLAGAQDWQGGGYVAVLREQMRWRGLDDRVYLPGYIADAERNFWYNGASVVVLPSWYEGFGFPAAESLACGVPVIAARAGSLPEVVGTAGWLCDPADVDAWAAALCEVCAMPALRARCQAQAAAYRARFSERAMAQATLAVYDHVLRGDSA